MHNPAHAFFWPKQGFRSSLWIFLFNIRCSIFAQMAVTCFECEKEAKWGCSKNCNKYWCQDCVQWNLRLQPLCRECQESVWEYIDDDEAMQDQQTADEKCEVDASVVAIRVFFCSDCKRFITAEEENEWPGCSRCGTMCFKCKVEVFCHLCNTWWATPDKLLSHVRMSHGTRVATKNNNEERRNVCVSGR